MRREGSPRGVIGGGLTGLALGCAAAYSGYESLLYLRRTLLPDAA